MLREELNRKSIVDCSWLLGADNLQEQEYATQSKCRNSHFAFHRKGSFLSKARMHPRTPKAVSYYKCPFTTTGDRMNGVDVAAVLTSLTALAALWELELDRCSSECTSRDT